MLVRVGSLMSRLRNGLGNIRISPTLGSLTWTGYNPDIGGGTRLLYPAPAALSWTTYAPSIALMIAVGVGASTYTGNAPTVTGVSQPSAAETLAGSETDALAIVYTDDHFKATTGFNGSVYCLDSGTPANDYDSSPTTETASYFTYTSPSPKMVLHDDGVLKYNAHNLYLNSASPANQSITVVSGATYAVTITGSVSVTASGAATGTWTAGTNTFTAATTTLTLGSTSGSGTVHVRRTPSDSTYMETAGSIRYADPIEFNSSGTSLGLLVEPQRTNLHTYSGSIGGPTWTLAAATVSLNESAGPTGLASFSLLTASSNVNAHVRTATLTLVPGTAYRISVYAKAGTSAQSRILLYDNTGGADEGVLTVDWSAGVPSQNSVSGSATGAKFKDVGGGIYRISVTITSDATNTSHSVYHYIDTAAGTGTLRLWGAQIEAGSSSATSPIETFASTVTRAADNISKATSGFPWSDIAGTLYFYGNSSNSQYGRYLAVANNGDRHMTYYNSGVRGETQVGYGAQALVGGTTVTVFADLRLAYSYAANDFALNVDGGAESADVSGSVPTGLTTLYIGSEAASDFMHGHVKAILYVPRRVSDFDKQTLTSTGALP